MICECCGKEFTEDWRKSKARVYALPRFCSRACANSRNFTIESRQRTSEAVKRSYEHKRPRRKLTEEELQQANERRRETFQAKYDNLPWEDLAPKGEAVKRRLLLEQGGVCKLCGLSTWMGKPLILQLDHIDGNNTNDNKENLRMICPNCHSQTETFCRGNTRKKRSVKTGNLHRVVNI